jgi:serine protease AprX
MYDDGGHGTFVDGLIAGNGSMSRPTDQGGKASTQYRGVAPDANIVSLKVLDSHGQGRASSLIAAIAWAICHRHQYNIRVMNISVEGDVTSPAAYDPLDRAVDAAWRAGIVVVCAAGNEGAFGQGGILSPGNDPYAITVGASDTQQTADPSDDTVCSYSSVGPTLYDEFAKPDLVAPGNHLVSLRAPWSWVDLTYPQTRVAVSNYIPGAPSWLPSSYAVMSGTSASAPVVAGAAALMVQQDPTLTPGDVKLRLMDSADPLSGASSYAQGAGELDVAAALADTTTTRGYDLSAKLGSGSTVLPPDVLLQWQKYGWSKYGWSKYGWSKYGWSKYGWSKYGWSKYGWSDYAWSVVINGQ